MTEYIEREKARDAVYERIEELRADKEFDIIKEICVSGVKKHIASIPAADVIERSKIDKAIKEMKEEYDNFKYSDNKTLGASFGIRKAIDILEKNLGE